MNDNEDWDSELNDLVLQIFDIIPSYFDQREADKIAELIDAYVNKRLSSYPVEQRE